MIISIKIFLFFFCKLIALSLIKFFREYNFEKKWNKFVKKMILKIGPVNFLLFSQIFEFHDFIIIGYTI